MKLQSGIIIIFLSLLLLCGIVSADALNPPISVNISGYISTHNQIGIYWINPPDADFNGTLLWFDNVYIGKASPLSHFSYREFLSPGYHEFSTQTIDTYGNINTTWQNITILNQDNFNCSEGWFCPPGAFCGGNITPTPTPTPRVPGNISQPQPPAQRGGAYTDIKLWSGMFIGAILCLTLSRGKIEGLRPVIFGAISFILSIGAVWTSLSVAYMGDFVEGAVVAFTNQTSQQVYYYQVIGVVANTPLTIICIIVMIFTILNIVDIGSKYIIRSEKDN